MLAEKVETKSPAEMDEIAERTVLRVMMKPREFPRPEGLDTYEPLADDVVVTTFPKSGTTLTQQLTYQIVVATGGAPSDDPDGLHFEDICEVAPYVDYGPNHGFIPRNSKPRVFKSHSPPQMFKHTTQKHILVFRDPCSYPASCLDFLYDALAGEKVEDDRIKELAFHKFIQVRLLGNPLTKDGSSGFGFPYEKDEKIPTLAENQLPVGPWFLHTKSWLGALRKGVLVLFYEDIIKDLTGTSNKIAKFIGKELSEDGMKQVLQRVDRDYMSKDPKFSCKLEAKVLGFYNTWKAKPASRKGFKQFKIKPQDLEGVKKRFQQEFGVPDYNGFMQMVKEKASQFE